MDEHIKRDLYCIWLLSELWFTPEKDINIIVSGKFNEYISNIVSAIGFTIDKSMLEYISSFN